MSIKAKVERQGSITVVQDDEREDGKIDRFFWRFLYVGWGHALVLDDYKHTILLTKRHKNGHEKASYSRLGYNRERNYGHKVHPEDVPIPLAIEKLVMDTFLNGLKLLREIER
jgi:hypothetical protein